MALNKFQDIKLRDKDREIFINAYDQYTDQIYRFVYFKVGNREEAQDLTSAIFLKTWEYIQKNKVKPKTLKALIYRIARNAVVDFYRSKSASRERISSLNDNLNINDDKQNPQKHIELKLDLVLVEECLTDLKDEYREVIILRFTEEFSISEIAEVLDKTKGNTRVLIYRALKALKEIIDNK